MLQETVCSDVKSLTLERFISNVGAKEISVSRDWMLESREYTVVFDRVGRIAALGSNSDPISDVNFGRTMVKLAAGAARRYETKLDLDDDFFHEPGFYKMRMHYWGAIRERRAKLREVRISSNWVIFEVRSCPSGSAQ